MSYSDSYPFIKCNKKQNKPKLIKKQKIVIAKYCVLSSVSKCKINEIINIIFMEFCNIDVYGYNSSYDEFWGKKDQHLYFRLELRETNGFTSIIINPIIGYEDDIKQVYNGIKNCIAIYENTF